MPYTTRLLIGPETDQLEERLGLGGRERTCMYVREWEFDFGHCHYVCFLSNVNPLRRRESGWEGRERKRMDGDPSPK